MKQMLNMGAWLSLSLLTTALLAQDRTKAPAAGKTQPQQTREAARNVQPAFQPPEVKPELPNVLLIGDSISIGYMLDARTQLAGEANVWRPATNCGPTTRGLESLDQWLGDRKWDVIHFNFGLHDLKYMGPKDENLADPKAPGSRQQVPIEQYAKNLREIGQRLKTSGATVIWCQTTPVPEGAKGRMVEDAKRYNEAAAQVMQELGIATNPLFEVATKHAQLQKKADVHYTPEGSEALATQVAQVIRQALKERPAQ
jgi:acyl-CoA thioesterase-1